MGLWSLARYELGLSEREFWKSTLRQLDALARRLAERERREDYRSAILAALIANQWKEKGEKPFLPGDFYPSLALRKKPEEVRASGAQQMKQFIKDFRKARDAARKEI